METADNKDKYRDDKGSNENNNSRDISNRDDLDSPVNKDFNNKTESTESLTNDEDADTDPNQVANKPSFKNDQK